MELIHLLYLQMFLLINMIISLRLNERYNSRRESIRKYKLVLQPRGDRWHVVFVNKQLEAIRQQLSRRRSALRMDSRENSFVYCEREPQNNFQKICKRYCHVKDGKKTCFKLCMKKIVKEKNCKT